MIVVNQLNKNARVNYEKYFNELKELVELDVGSTCFERDENDGNGNSSKDVLNPSESQQKWVQNKIFKSIVEKKSDKIKQRKSKKLSTDDVCVSKGSHHV